MELTPIYYQRATLERLKPTPKPSAESNQTSQAAGGSGVSDRGDRFGLVVASAAFAGVVVLAVLYTHCRQTGGQTCSVLLGKLPAPWDAPAQN